MSDSKNAKNHQYPKKIQMVAKKFGIDFIYMPRNFERRKDNRTRVSKKEDRIFWHYSMNLGTEISCASDEKESKTVIIAKNSIDGSSDIKTLFKCNKIDFDEYDIFLADMTSGRSRLDRKLIKLDKKLSLNHAMEGLTILEYPEFFLKKVPNPE